MGTDKANRDLELLKNHIAQLSEHFDTAQIFVTRHDRLNEGGTVNAVYGGGNFLARYGQVQQWVIYQDEMVRAEMRRSHAEDEN